MFRSRVFYQTHGVGLCCARPYSCWVTLGHARRFCCVGTAAGMYGFIFGWLVSFIFVLSYPAPRPFTILMKPHGSLAALSARFPPTKRSVLSNQTVCCMYVCGQRKCGGIGAPPTCPGTPCGGSMGEETTYDRSFNASSHRTHSNSSAGSHGPGETGGMPPMGGLGGAGGWANMEMGMDGVP